MGGILDLLDSQQVLNLIIEFVPNLVVAIGLLTLFWVLYRVTCPPLESALERAGIHQTVVRMLVRNIYRVILLVFGLVMAADQLGINVAAAVAGIGVAGLAVGFAAQESLANVIAGFLIFIDKPFQVGDWVSVEGQYGSINEITMRSTRIRTVRNTYVVIPNSSIINSVLTNHSKHGATRVDIPIGIAYKEHIPTARRVILEALGAIEGVLADPSPDVVVTELGDSSVNMEVRVWIETAARENPFLPLPWSSAS
jgi:small conductance mechanosensitive channel